MKIGLSIILAVLYVVVIVAANLGIEK